MQPEVNTQELMDLEEYGEYEDFSEYLDYDPSEYEDDPASHEEPSEAETDAEPAAPAGLQPEEKASPDAETSGTGLSEESAEEHPADTGDPGQESGSGSVEKITYGLRDEDYYNIDELKEKIEQRKHDQVVRNRKSMLKFWGTILGSIAAIALFFFSLTDYFSVDTIQVEGNEHFTSEEIINIAHAVRGHNLIYDPGKKEIIEYLEHNPYIESAEVRRRLPSTLVIKVSEREELFAFGYDDDYLIMDEEGTLLRKTRTVPKLTIAEGIVVSRIKLGEKIGAKKELVLDKCLKLLKAMRKGDLYFVKVDLSDIADNGSKVKTYIYDNLIVKSDYDLLIKAIEDDRLHMVVSRLIDDGISRGTILINDDGTISYQPGF
jgi:cell division protein FtsQ